MARLNNGTDGVLHLGQYNNPDETNITTQNNALMSREEILNSLQGTNYYDLALNNPYDVYDYNPSVWDKIGNFFGWRTGEDKYLEEMSLKAREYNSNLLDMYRQEQYNSENSSAERMRQSGLNPDLLGTENASTAPAQDANLNPTSYNDDNSFGNIISSVANGISLVYSGIELGFDIRNKNLQATGLQLENESKSIDNKNKSFGYESNRSNLFSSYFDIGKQLLKNVNNGRYAQHGSVYAKDEHGRTQIYFQDFKDGVYSSLFSVPKEFEHDIVSALNDFYHSTENRTNIADTETKFVDSRNKQNFNFDLYGDLDAPNIVMREITQELAKVYRDTLNTQYKLENKSLHNRLKFENTYDYGTDAETKNSQNKLSKKRYDNAFKALNPTSRVIDFLSKKLEDKDTNAIMKGTYASALTGLMMVLSSADTGVSMPSIPFKR